MESTQPKSSKGLREPREPRAARGRKSLEKQRNTLTQMDFLAIRRHEDEMGEEGPGMISMGDDGFEEGNIETGKEDVDPDTGEMLTRAKRESALPLEQITSKEREKRSKASVDETAHLPDWHDSTPRSTTLGGVHRKALSEPNPGRRATNATARSILRATRATTKADAEQPKVDPARRLAQDEKENLEPGDASPRYSIPETPRKRRDVIPSSQSPESVTPSSRRRPALLLEDSERSPLRERSTNVTPAKSSRVRQAPGLIPPKNGISPKKKICVLRYGPRRFRQPGLPEAELHGVDVRGRKTARTVQAPYGNDENSVKLSFKDIEGKNGALDLSQQAMEPEISETSQLVQPEMIPSSQKDTEEEEEIPETSQGLRRVTSTPSASRSEESLRMLSDADNTPLTAKRTRSTESLGQLEPHLLDAEVQVHDFGSTRGGGDGNLGQLASAARQMINDVSTSASKFPVQLPQKEGTVSTIDDSQDEEDEDDDMTLGLPAFMANGIGSHDSPIIRGPGSPTTSIQQQLPTQNTPTSPNLPTPPQFSHPPATIIRIPTKLPPSSSPSSPTLPTPPTRTAHQRPPTTQQSIQPASVARPSQVSTQAPTQQSWLPVSSIPFPFANTVSASSPNPSNNAKHFTIKDSSSQAMPLRDIPSQSQWQTTDPLPLVDLRPDYGIGDDVGIDLDNDLDRRDDGDLDPKSSPAPLPPRHPRAANPEPDNTQDPHPEQQLAHAATADTKTHQCTEQQERRRPDDHEVARHRRSRNDHIIDTNHKALKPPTPLPRLQLSDSMLESLPGPPGWIAPPSSQRSWDDSML